MLFLLFFNILFAKETMYFDGHKAMDYLEYQCSFGPRYPGSAGHTEFGLSLESFLKERADFVHVFKDSALSQIDGEKVELKSIIARFNPTSDYRIMIMAHWDTRKYADMEDDEKKVLDPVLGANDGASGIAVLMSLSDILKDNKLYNIGVDLLFIDGEDMGISGNPDSWAVGTQLIAKNMLKPYPEYAICLDMIGDKEQKFYIEGFSYMYAPEIVEKVWTLANDLGYTQFVNQVGKPIIDDHYALMKYTGIPAIDIIDFEYPNTVENYWHTTEDTPDKCSAASLESVGTVIATLIYKEENK